MIKRALFTLLKWMNLFIFFWFLFFVRPRWIGYIVAFIFSYRLLKQWWNPRKPTALAKLVDCSYHHSHDDGHRHVGKVPDKERHVHSNVRPNLKDKHKRHHRSP